MTGSQNCYIQNLRYRLGKKFHPKKTPAKKSSSINENLLVTSTNFLGVILNRNVEFQNVLSSFPFKILELPARKYQKGILSDYFHGK